MIYSQLEIKQKSVVQALIPMKLFIELAIDSFFELADHRDHRPNRQPERSPMDSWN